MLEIIIDIIGIITIAIITIGTIAITSFAFIIGTRTTISIWKK